MSGDQHNQADPLDLDAEDEFLEGCPDCGRDTVTEVEGAMVCGFCGWRE